MSEISTPITAELEPTPSLEGLFAELLEQEPKPISNFVPTNAKEQREIFINGDARKPDNDYGKLQAIDFESKKAKITELLEQIVAHPDVKDKFRTVYEQFGQNYLDKTEYMSIVNEYNQSEDGDAKLALGNKLMKKNVELFGEPDKRTYDSILSEKIESVKAMELSEQDAQIRTELLELIGERGSEKVERFKPSDETVKWVGEVVDALFGTLIEHVPNQENFSDVEIKAIFDEIIKEEFGESAEGWVVDIEKAQGINVKASEKRIVIPEGKELDLKNMKGRVVHELGTHFLRSLMGEQTDLLPFKLGLSEYYDSEEGLGVVTEQALDGKYDESGLGHYLTAGLAYFDQKDFRDIYEIKWRLELLENAKLTADEKGIASAKDTAYTNTMRIMRGTDDLPWFKDLSYYNGAAEVWQHMENIRGDEVELMLVLLGKGNAANPAHRRIMLETATV